MAILCKARSIRDVIAFPKTVGGADLQFRSPAAVSAEILSQYGIQPR
jgi:aspartyl-tRNA synthetase